MSNWTKDWPQAMYVVIMYQLQINICIKTCLYIGYT